MLNVEFLEKGLGLIFPPYFMYDYWRKILLLLYTILNLMRLGFLRVALLLGEGGQIDSSFIFQEVLI